MHSSTSSQELHFCQASKHIDEKHMEGQCKQTNETYITSHLLETDIISCSWQLPGTTTLKNFWVVLHQHSILQKRPNCYKITTKYQIQGLLVSRLLKPRIIEFKEFKDCWIQISLNSRLLSSRAVESKIVESKYCWIYGLLNRSIVKGGYSVTESKDLLMKW